jgi:signal transduction histidine kinase
MPNGGNLTVRGSAINDDVVISVEDTGVGIPDEIKTKLFTPMTTTKAKGQGFGLAVVKRLIEALNGTINFESKVGKGTKFIINLPKESHNRRIDINNP